MPFPRSMITWSTWQLGGIWKQTLDNLERWQNKETYCIMVKLLHGRNTPEIQQSISVLHLQPLTHCYADALMETLCCNCAPQDGLANRNVDVGVDVHSFPSEHCALLDPKCDVDLFVRYRHGNRLTILHTCEKTSNTWHWDVFKKKNFYLNYEIIQRTWRGVTLDLMITDKS